MNETRPSPAATIELVLVHHGVESRVAAAQPTVGKLREALSEFGTVDLREIWQQTLVPVPARELAARRLRQWRLERRWSTYLGVSRRWFLSTGLLGLRMIQLLDPRYRARAGHQAAIELALTGKHVQAWQSALDSGADLLVVVEDDARWREDSGDRVRRLVEAAVSAGRLQDSFIDLAGGLPLGALRLDGVRRVDADGTAVLTRAATNTTCGYAAGSAVVAALVAHAADPAAAPLPSDWLINSCFLALSDASAAPDVLCLHSEPTALDHGSFTGSVASSIRP